ncbi:MAG: CusA/CzcA family heavy metal efflux RND transporter [Bacteroidia bacterium]|jgi:cobalt-zinc-cadmium resistance protein CzcA|nr:CusA/CzcA family heavy metal efflux RND transporter [Bacteroidia bacterium]
MLNAVIRFSMRNKLVIGLFVLALIAWGTWSLTRLPVDAVPDITNNQAQVITVTPSLAAQEVERLITFPVEQTMATIPGITEIRSISRFGLSVVTIVFSEQTDIYWARQQISERLPAARMAIPPGTGSPELAPVTTGLGEIYQYTLRVKPGYEARYDASELRTIQDWQVRRQLIGVEGVAEVSSFGGHLKQYEIAVNPDKLRAMNVSFEDIFTTLERNNQNTGGAYIDKEPKAWFIRSEGLFGSPDDIAGAVIRLNENGTPLLLRDVATVTFGSATRYGAMTIDGKGEAVGAVVMMLKGANSSQVIEAVKKRITQINKTLPEGVSVAPFLDRTALVNKSVSTVTVNLLEGALIVIFVLVLFLGNLRAGLVVASVIPLSLLFAIGMMVLTGVSGNLMSLGAIDFGLIVDGAVIIVEATLHHLHLRQPGRLLQPEMDVEVESSAKRLMRSAVFGELIILIVYLPILALSGVEGKMFRPMAETVAYAILGAFVFSLTYVPVVSSLLLSKNISGKVTLSDRMIGAVRKAFLPLLERALRRPVIIISSAVALLAGAVLLFGTLGGEFIPTLEEGDFAVEMRLLKGSSLQQTINTSNEAAKIIRRNFPEVKHVVAKIGSSEVPTDPMPIESGDLIITLKDRHEWTSADTREELAEKMGQALSIIPGVTFGFQQPIQMRFNELMTGARQDVAVKIFGEDLDSLTAVAARIARLVPGIEGCSDLYVEEVSGLEQIVVRVQREKLAVFGLHVDDVNRTLQTAFAGAAAGQVFEGERRFDLVVRLDAAHRNNIDDVSALYVTTPGGQQIPITQVAEVKTETGANQIQREDAKRRLTIGFNVRGRDVESVVNELRGKIDGEIKMPPGFYVTYGGQFENLVEARSRLAVAVPVALLLILLLLFFNFGNMRHSLLIFSAIPFSAVGGIVALWLRDMPFSISAGVGFIALFGVAVLNGIVLVAEFNRLRTEELPDDLLNVIRRGIAVRLRPVLMTATVASLGFLPMAISNGAGAEVQKPLATVVIGGLISATLLTLLVLPVLYLLIEQKHLTRMKTKHTAALLAVVLLLATGTNANAQTALPLDSCVQMALRQSPKMRAANASVAQQQTLVRATFTPGTTQAEYSQGNINSPLRDNMVSVSQSIVSPALLISNRNLAQAQVQQQQAVQQLTQQQLLLEVKQTWLLLAAMKAQEKLLVRHDSLLQLNEYAAQRRYAAGDGTQLETTVARSERLVAAQQLMQHQAEIRSTEKMLQLLTGSAVPVTTPPGSELTPVQWPLYDSLKLATAPQLVLAQQTTAVAELAARSEKARLWPELTAGYFNQSIVGYQNINGQDVFIGSNQRFDGFRVGVSFPLGTGAQAARIKAARLGQTVAEEQEAQQHLELQMQLLRLEQERHSLKTQLALYTSQLLPQADLQEKQAVAARQSGSLNQTEYLQAMAQVLSIRLRHQQLIQFNNQLALEFNFLCGTL